MGCRELGGIEDEAGDVTAGDRREPTRIEADKLVLRSHVLRRPLLAAEKQRSRIKPRSLSLFPRTKRSCTSRVAKDIVPVRWQKTTPGKPA